MTVYHINDGPDYQPNKKRKVIRLRPSDVPGMILCRDVDTEEQLTIEIGKLERAKKETR